MLSAGVGAALSFPRTIPADTPLSSSLGRDPLCLCECAMNSRGDIGGKSTTCGAPAGVFQRRRDLVLLSQPEPLESNVQEERCHDQYQLTALSCSEPSLSGVSLTAEELPSPQAADFNAEGMISTALPVQTGRTMCQACWKFLPLKSHLGPQS